MNAIHSRLIAEDQFFENLLTRENLQGLKLNKVIEHLRNAHKNYNEKLIPKVDQLFLKLISEHKDVPSLYVLFNLFQKFCNDLKLHMDIEEKQLFNKCESFYENGAFLKFNPFELHQDEEPFLVEIIKYLSKIKGLDQSSKRQLMYVLNYFDNDLKEHAWIEENILSEKIKASIISKI